MPRTWVKWKCEASILDNQWRRFNTSHPQAAMPKTPATTLMCSVAVPPPAQSSAHSPSTPSTSVSKPAEPQPMDLDCTKSKNPPQICYNCNKPGHITQNCLEPHVQQVRNTDPLSPETIQAIVEAVRIAVRGDAMRGEGATGNVEPARSEAKESQDF